ncbi:MAG: hypothetical protein Q9170_007366 [Blastenia crenularia]
MASQVHGTKQSPSSRVNPFPRVSVFEHPKAPTVQPSPEQPEGIDIPQADPFDEAEEEVTTFVRTGRPTSQSASDTRGSSRSGPTSYSNPFHVAESYRNLGTLHEEPPDDRDWANESLAEILSAASSANKSESALHYACQHGIVKYVDELLEKGVSVHSRVKQAIPDTFGPGAIHLAAMHRQSSVALTLLKHGALPNDQYHDRRRPLHDAAEAGDDTTTALLLEHGAKPDLCDSRGIEPLHLACRNGSLKVVRLLIDAGASVDAMDHKSYRPLHHVAQSCGDPYLALYLIESGCDFEARTCQGHTALQLACMAGKYAFVEVLLHNSASPETGERLAKPLALAIANGHMKTARLLLENGVEVNYRSPNTHETIVHLVARGSFSAADLNPGVDSSTLALLCQYGANVNAQDIYGNTPVHLAISTLPKGGNLQHQRAMVNSLLKNGARADIQNRDGCYPLTLASHSLDLQVFRLMLAASIRRLPDKDLAGIDRDIRRRKAPASHPDLNAISALLSTALVARTLQV